MISPTTPESTSEIGTKSVLMDLKLMDTGSHSHASEPVTSYLNGGTGMRGVPVAPRPQTRKRDRRKRAAGEAFRSAAPYQVQIAIARGITEGWTSRQCKGEGGAQVAYLDFLDDMADGPETDAIAPAARTLGYALHRQFEGIPDDDLDDEICKRILVEQKAQGVEDHASATLLVNLLQAAKDGRDVPWPMLRRVVQNARQAIADHADPLLHLYGLLLEVEHRFEGVS